MKNFILKILRWVLKKIAQATIWRFNPDVIAITGSVGKTSAKEAIFAVLSSSGGKNRYRVRKASENFNNELGAPLTILGNWEKIERPLLLFWLKVIIFSLIRLIFLPRSFYPKILVLEYGASKPGDIKYLLEIAKPKIAVISAIGDIPVHIEHYEDSAAVAKEKSKLIEDLSTVDSVVLNFDDDLTLEMKEKTRAKTITFGFNEGADIKITNFENQSETESGKPLGVSFKLEYGGSFVPVSLKGIFGWTQGYAGAIGLAVGLIYNLNLVEAAENFSANYRPAKRRMSLIEGVKNTYIIDDSYNASPLAMRQALETLKDLKGARKIAVLGDMLELGKYSLEAHEQIGKLAAGIVDILITVGPRGKFIAEGAKTAGFHENKILSFDIAEEAAPEIQKLIKKGDLILVKASRAVELDKIVEEIKK